ncbi:helix-turn-helix domain-containing protein [Weissella confusa]|jgi:transcriptional regulator with XRE-family HTH domain|uniref:helix-turn-helix domain-containing protein n=1 Tax=Weissella confusa TaxID=1583 RepID=UPI00107F190B|nr:helix-turn-helix transcriptional regulator [Weissella confusa]MBD5833083.1 XRE family transcriptional regulator [Weissella confusa]MBJ7631368.1 helix-turn-helix transcriptional regulator [Weissella confusa]MBJ7635534.1 helix-turn-helix transcriptional regulator [Weissella confusa]MBJ7640746.1 helix-turn-helix transcriptional regulator [Weissella confusa]MBJ7654890.1 helix-turn-helix transcriptional regulator [Weissella confusa]
MTTFERIKKVANERGYSLKKLAIDAGFSENALYRYNQGVEPKYSTVAALAKVLGVSVDYLLGNTDEMHSNKKDDMPVDLEEVLDKLGPTLRFEGKELTDEQKIKLYEMAKLMLGE